MNDVPIQFTWQREIGSTWRYQLGKNITESELIQDRRFADFVKYGYLTQDALSVQFEYLLTKIHSGEYLLEIGYLHPDLDVVESQAGQASYFEYDGYGGLEDVIQTQAYLDEATIQEYRELMEKGPEPIMVVLSCHQSVNKFILDGHHKFIAYKRLKRPAKALMITRMDCTRIDRQTGLTLFESCKCRNTEYINWFLQRVKE